VRACVRVYIYIYIYMCVCVCVCVCLGGRKGRGISARRISSFSVLCAELFSFI
jgi:hypothetical protein